MQVPCCWSMGEYPIPQYNATTYGPLIFIILSHVYSYLRIFPLTLDDAFMEYLRHGSKPSTVFPMTLADMTSPTFTQPAAGDAMKRRLLRKWMKYTLFEPFSAAAGMDMRADEPS